VKLDKLATAAWTNAAKASAAWPKLGDSTVTYVGVCDEHVRGDTSKVRPAITFALTTAKNERAETYKTEYVLKVTVGTASWTVQKTWPQLLEFYERLSGSGALHGVTLPEFPSSGTFLGIGGGEPDTAGIEKRRAEMETFFNSAGKLNVVSSERHFMEFAGLSKNLDSKVLQDDVLAGGYLCFARVNNARACIKYEAAFADMLGGTGNPTVKLDLHATGASDVDLGIEYLFDQQIAGAIAQNEADLVHRCDQYPPGLLGDDVKTDGTPKGSEVPDE